MSSLVDNNPFVSNTANSSLPAWAVEAEPAKATVKQGFLERHPKIKTVFMKVIKALVAILFGGFAGMGFSLLTANPLLGIITGCAVTAVVFGVLGFVEDRINKNIADKKVVAKPATTFNPNDI